MLLRCVTCLGLGFLIGGCQSGASDEPASTDALEVSVAADVQADLGKAEAFRFLNQATFGATEKEAERLQRMGIEAWLEDQLAQPASLQLPHLKSLPGDIARFELQSDRLDIWFRNALHGRDQLRQRMAFALSEIFVVSEIGALRDAPFALASYHDLLTTHAFGNFRDLLEAVTLHPAMGVYLSMLGNRKADPEANIRPDENFAREVMQLFTIGLVELNPDGTPKLDGQGNPIPTYDQDVIEEFSRIYTGWHYTGAPNFLRAKRTTENQVVPMQLYQAYHDSEAKTLFDRVNLPAKQPGQDDLDAALDTLFEHPNVGPFIAYRLIQRFVSSNPSPAYVERVANTFNDNGSGVRGDLGAVMLAVLLDPEARSPGAGDTRGKVKEPLLRLTQFWRAYDGRSGAGTYKVNRIVRDLGQAPLEAPSVFNFFSPTYEPPGEMRERGLASPELELATEYRSAATTNVFHSQTLGLLHEDDDANGDAEAVRIEIEEEASLASDPAALAERVIEKLLGGDAPEALRKAVTDYVRQLPEDKPRRRAAEAVFLIASSPAYAVQG